MPLSSYARDKLLDHLLKGTAFTQPTDVYISIHTADPGLTGASEASGGSYARQSGNSSFAAAGSGAKASNAVIAFAGMPAGTFTHFGIWDALTTGNFLWGGALAASKTLGAGDTIQFSSGQLTLNLT
jgi:hypothetical protein